MGKIFEFTAKILTERKHSKAWHRLSMLIACLVVFATTYSMILPALTFDDVTASEEPGFDIGVTEEVQEEVSVEDTSYNESELLAEEPVQNDPNYTEDYVEDYTAETGSAESGELVTYEEPVVYEEPVAVPTTDTTEVFDDSTVTTEEAGFVPEDNGETADFTDTEEPETILTYEDAEVRITASFEDPTYVIPAGLTLKVNPVAYGSETFEALNAGANERLTEIGNYVISYSAYYDIWFELNGETVLPAPIVKLEAQYKNRDLGENGVKLFSYNYDGNAITLHDDVTWGVYDDTDPSWPWRSSFTFRTHGGDVTGHTIVGLMNTEVVEKEATEGEAENTEEENTSEETADPSQDAAAETTIEETGSEEAQTEEVAIGTEEIAGEEDYEVVEEDVIPAEEAADDEMAEDETAVEETAEDEAADDETAEEETAEDEAATDESSEEEDAEEEASLYKEGQVTFKGEDYTVELEVPEAARIPEDAELVVEEIDPETEEYKTYYDQAMAAIKETGRDVTEGFGRFFDIRFEKDGVEIEPNPVAQIAVKITFDKTVDAQNETVNAESSEVQGVHFTEDGVEEVKVESQGEAGTVDQITFEASSFSVYGFVYTVDFETTDEEGNVYKWSWPGEGSYSIASILAQFGVTDEISDVSLKRTIDEGGAENALYLEEKEDGWYLTSEVPFKDTFELRVTAGKKSYVVVVTDAVGESTNLTDFLQAEDTEPPAVSLTINGVEVSSDSTNPTPVRTGDSFSLNLHFREINGGVQFADGSEMSMTLPAALSGFPDNYTQNISVVLNDTDPNGNKYTVPAVVKIDPSTNKLTLQWPEPAEGADRTAYDLLKASGNAYVDISINGTIGENRDTLVFKGGIERYIEENPAHSLSLTKNGNYDKESGRINYSIRVNSEGTNENVTVVDTIENADKTALIFDSSSNFRYTVYNKDGSKAKETTTFTVSGNSFEQNIGTLTNGQYAVIEYSAKVDTTRITGTGTVEQTGNTVSIKDNTDVPPVTHDLHNQIDWTSVSKRSTGVTGGTDTNTKVAHWEITANAEQRGSMGGKTITDTIGYNSKDIMTYANGITVKWYDGDTYVGEETLTFGNDRLTLTDKTDNKGQSWAYTVPTGHSGHNYKYVITYDTNVDVSGQLQTIQVTNDVETEGKKGQGHADVEPGIDKVTIDKNVVPNGTVINGHTIVTDKDYTSWVAEIEIPATGLSSAVLEDYLPKTIINGVTYIDEYVPNTLLFGGDWNGGIDDYDFYDFSEDENNPRIRIEFKQKDGTAGLKGTGSRRTIKVYYQTRNDPTWVETYLPGSNGAEWHTNTAKIIVGDRSIQTQESVLPPYPTVKKAAQAYNSVNIEGKNYPLYRYTVTLYGITKEQIQAGVTITDTHDSKLVYYPLRQQWDDELIVGEIGQHDGSHDVYPTFSDSGTNMTITAGSSCFPLNNGEPYSYYTLHYYMRAANVDELISDSMANISPDGRPGTVEMNNTVVWDGHSDDATVTYDYPGLDKVLMGTNGRVAQFKIILNPAGTKIGTGDTVKLVDEYENLSVDYSTIHWEPDTVNISYDFSGNKGTYVIPNETPVTLYYNARILGDGDVNFKNTATFGDWVDEVDEWRHLDVQGSGGAENYKIRIYKYASEHMEIPLGDTTFKLLDSNKQDMHPYKRDDDGKVVTHDEGGVEVPEYDTEKLITFTTGSNGYVTVMLDSSKIGYALEKDKVYYLEEIEAKPGFERDYIQYSFEISDSVEYDQKNGVYRYYNNDILKVSNETEQGGLIIVKSLSGINWENLTAEEEEIINNIKFTIHGKFKEEIVDPDTGAVTLSADPVEKDIVVHYSDFVDGRYRINPDYLVVGESYTVTEESAAIEGYHLVTTYRADANSPTGTATDAHVEFTAEDFSTPKSHRLSVNNDYSTYSYNFKKAEMGSLEPTFEDGPIYLRGAEFSSYEVGGDGTAKKVYKTDSLGEFGIRWIDHCYEYNKLYYVVETKAPEGYEMLPESKTGEYADYDGPLREKYYFYFSDPEAATPWEPADGSVPSGKTAYDLTLGSQNEDTIENGAVDETTTQLEIRKDWKDLNAQGEAGNDISAETIAANHPEWVENGIPYRVYQVFRKDTEGGAYTSDELKALARQFIDDPDSVDCTLFTTENTPDGDFRITYEKGRTYPWYGQVDGEMPLSRTLYGNTTHYGYFVIDEAEGFVPAYSYSGTGFNDASLSHLHLYNIPEQTELYVKKKWIAPKAYSEFGLQFKIYRDAEDGEEGDPNHNGWVYVPTNPDTFELNKGNNWERTVSGLKKGWTYHIVETSVTNSEAPLSDWIQAFSGGNQFQGGETVELTNTYNGKALEVKKIWNVDDDTYMNYKVKVKVYRRVKGTTEWSMWQEVELNKDNSWAKFWKPGQDGFPAVNDETEYEYYIGDETVKDGNNQDVDMSQYSVTYSATEETPIENQGMMNVTNTKYDGEVTVDKQWLNVDGTTEAKPGSSAEFILQRAESVEEGTEITVNAVLEYMEKQYLPPDYSGTLVPATMSKGTKTIVVGEGSNVILNITSSNGIDSFKYSVNGSEYVPITGTSATIENISGSTTITLVGTGGEGNWRTFTYDCAGTVPGTYVPGSYEDVPGTTIVLPRDQNAGDWKYKWDDLPIRTPDGGQYFYTVRETKINGWPVEDSVAYESEYVTTDNDKQRAGDGAIVIRNKEKPGSLKLKKLVTVGGQPTDGKLADDEYTFTLKKQVSTTDTGTDTTTVNEVDVPAGKSPIVITIENGTIKSATVGGSAVTVGEDGYVEVDGLEKGTYVLCEETPTNGTTLSKLEEGFERDQANRKIIVNVLAGRTGNDVRVAAKGTFTNNIETGTLELNKQIDGSDANPEDEFTFEISLELPEGVHDATFKANIGTEVQPDITTAGRKAKIEGIKLKGSQTYRIVGLPIGTSYTIKETDAKDYVSDLSAEGVSGSISQENSGVSFVQVTNTKFSTGNLKLVKTLTMAGTKPTKSYYFTVSDGTNYYYMEGTTLKSTTTAPTTKDSTGVIAVTADSADGVTLTDLPAKEYTVTELDFEKSITGYTLSSTTYKVGDGDPGASGIVVVESGATKTVTTNNTYTKDITYTPKVTKSLTGREWKSGDSFTFTISRADEKTGVTMPTGTGLTATVTDQTAGKTASFGAITFSSADTYSFTVQETVPDDAENGEGLAWKDADDSKKAAGGFKKDGITYDGSAHTVTVKVENVNNELKVTEVTVNREKKTTDDAIAAAATTVENSYTASGTVPFKAKKTLTGGKLTEKQFEFELIEYTDDTFTEVKTGGVNQSKNNAAPAGTATYGDVIFDDVTLTDTNSRYFRIREKVPTGTNADGSIIYDTHTQDVAVTVTDDGKGNLVPTKAYTPAFSETGYDASFENIKKGALKLTKAVEVNGSSTNDTIADGDYTFSVAGPDPSTDVIKYIKITVTNGSAVSYKVSDDDTDEAWTAASTVTSGSAVLQNLAPGDYTITETGLNGLTLKSITGGKSSDVGNMQAIVTVTAGDNEPASTNAAAQVTFTNNKTDKTDIEATKKWMSGSTEMTAWPSDIQSVEFTLYAKVGDEEAKPISDDSIQSYFGSQPVTQVINTEDSVKKAVWSNLPNRVLVTESDPTNQTWKTVTYTVKESKVTYKASGDATPVVVTTLTDFSPSDGTSGNNYVVTNTPKTEISGTKTWEIVSSTFPDNPTLKLTRTSAKSGSTAEDVKDATDDTKYLQPTTWTGEGKTRTFTYTDLPKYDAEGYEYEYTVTEASFTINNVTYDVIKNGDNHIVKVGDNVVTTFEVTQEDNDIINTEKKDFEFYKVWWDTTSQPEEWPTGKSISVTVERTAEGSTNEELSFKLEYTITSIPTATATTVNGKNNNDPKLNAQLVTEGGKTKYKFWLTGLDAKNAVGNEYVYSVTETKVDGYKDPIYEQGATNAKDGQSITNQPENSVSLPETGGRGTLPFTISGSILLAFSALMYVTSFRRRREEALVRNGGYFESDAQNGAMRGGGSRR